MQNKRFIWIENHPEYEKCPGYFNKILSLIISGEIIAEEGGYFLVSDEKGQQFKVDKEKGQEVTPTSLSTSA